MRRLLDPRLFALTLLWVVACQQQPAPPVAGGDAGAAPPATVAALASSAAPASAPGFFDPGKVFEGAVDPQKEVQAVPCVGDAADGSDDKPFHPQKIRGTVWGPFGRFAAVEPPARPVWQRWMEGGLDLVSTPAYAHPLPEERAIGEVEVRLVVVDARGEVVEELLKATTDAAGHYCFRVPDAHPIKPDLVVMVGDAKQGTLMRRNVASRSTNDLFSQPEALFRALVRSRVDLTTLPRQEFGNLYSLTDTIVDDRVHTKPLVLPEGTRIQKACALVQRRLEAHPRFKEKVADLHKRYPTP